MPASKRSKKHGESNSPRQSFWSPSAKDFLVECGRQDSVDSGDALAERVCALLLTAMSRLDQYAKQGDLYCGRGGQSDLAKPEALAHLDEFVTKRLHDEIEALEHLLEVFDDLREREAPAPEQKTGSNPSPLVLSCTVLT
jgi:hypothetical protein